MILSTSGYVLSREDAAEVPLLGVSEAVPDEATAGGLPYDSAAVGRITIPVRSFGVKKVDFGGISRPSRAVR